MDGLSRHLRRLSRLPVLPGNDRVVRIDLGIGRFAPSFFPRCEVDRIKFLHHVSRIDFPVAAVFVVKICLACKPSLQDFAQPASSVTARPVRRPVTWSSDSSIIARSGGASIPPETRRIVLPAVQCPCLTSRVVAVEVSAALALTVEHGHSYPRREFRDRRPAAEDGDGAAREVLKLQSRRSERPSAGKPSPKSHAARRAVRSHPLREDRCRR